METSPKPTRIQSEVTRLQEMCEQFLNRNPEDENGMQLCGTVVPEVERWRAQALKEVEGEGITSTTYTALANEMASGESLAWAIYDDFQDIFAKIIVRQFDHIHVLMNETGVEDPNPPETHKCWPPGSVCH